MSGQQKLSVSYGSFSCDIIGFEDPLPVLQDVIGEFRRIAWRYPGFGAQKGDAQRDRLSRLVAAKLDAALAGNGVSITVDGEYGGLVAQPIDGAGKGEGWGSLHSKPKPSETFQKSDVKHAAAVATAASIAEAPPAPEPEALDGVAEAPRAAAGAPAEPDPVEEISPAAEEPSAETRAIPEIDPPTPVETRDAVAEVEPVEANVGTPEPEAPAEPDEPSVLTLREPLPAPAIDETETEEPVEVHDEEEIEVEQPVAAADPAPDEEAPSDLEPEPVAEPEEEDLDLVAARIRAEVESVVDTEIKGAFAEFRGEPAPAAKAPAASQEPEGEHSRTGLFARFLGGIKKPASSASAPQAPEREKPAAAEKAKPAPEKAAPKGGDDALDAAFNAIARQSGAAPVKDFVFADKPGQTGGDDTALLLSKENAFDPSRLAEPNDAEERVAKAKARVMERARERQEAQQAATERRLRIIRRERVEERADTLAGVLKHAAAGEPAMTAEEFAKLIGAASLQELMEASAAYATLVGGKHKFTRNDLMEVMGELDKAHSYSHEARLKSFGRMLRTGVLLRVDDGLFAMSQSHRHPYETKLLA